ncbi:hypothetical protein EVAR_14242_1 [Eumeta japonica]|uniref:Uncharacterized protein n=1 Tax=Eumeta variegata TaxID=151549 RepID=A0A4C1W9L0_EUMVA|nr:hypothetical protein EVAR_14242_1 [Eumeta japonica]
MFFSTWYISNVWSHAHRTIPSELSDRKKKKSKYTFKWFDGHQISPTITRITVIDENLAENIESEEIEELNDAEEDVEFYEDHNVIIDIDDSCAITLMNAA